MNIFVDESGLFVPSQAPDSWNAVGAYVSTERSRKGMENALSHLKKGAGVLPGQEIKLRHLDAKPWLYHQFLTQLNNLDGVLYVSVANAYLDDEFTVKRHQAAFVEDIQKQIPRMRYGEGKDALRTLAAQALRLSPQLYAQLFHQTGLIEHIARSAILYFVQRYPATLREFRWRIDRKGERLSDYEDVFQKVVPILLQASSIRNPSIFIRGYDYSHLVEYWVPTPAYLKEDYGLNIEQERTLDLQKIFRKDLKFLDSKKSTGLQIVDLLVSGVRRCMRGEFNKENDLVAKLLGRLMVQPSHGEQVVKIMTFSTEQYLTGIGRRAVMIMNKNHRQMRTN